MRRAVPPARLAALTLLACAAPEAAAADYGLTEADPADPVFDSAAFRHFTMAFADLCYWSDDPEPARFWAPQSWPLEWRTDYSDAPLTATLYRFFCDMGAYNVRFVWYLDGGYEDRPAPIAFAAPQIDVAYVDGNSEGPVDSITVRGWRAHTSLINAEFDPQTRTIASASHWRGLGDASTRGLWAFDDGDFVLKRYEIDATYDGEIEPQKVLEFE